MKLSKLKFTYTLSLLLLIGISFLSCNNNMSFNKKRKILVERLNILPIYSVCSSKFSYDSNTLIILTVEDFNKNDFKDKDIPNAIFLSCTSQLKCMVEMLKLNDYENIDELGFDKVLFKTNIIRNKKTAYCHFLFSLSELRFLPEYIDEEVLLNYIVLEKHSENITLNNFDEF